jgi:hypothetical protein
MKNSKTILIIITAIVSAVVLPNCQPESAKVYIPRESGNVASVTGVWKGVSVIQRDNDAEKKNFPYKTQDITSALDFTKVTLTLNSSSNLPGTFTINYGTAPAFFKLTSGQWKADNVNKIGSIQLYNGLDTVKLVMGNYLLLDQNKMKIVQAKTLLGQAVVTYEFNFSK